MKTYARAAVLTTFLFSANGYSLEVTPLLGYRGGGEFNDNTTNTKHTIVGSKTYGFIIGGEPYDGGKILELYYSHQSSDLNSINVISATSNTADVPLTVDYLHFGGTTPISTDGKLKTFMSGGLGFTYLSPDFTGFQSDLRASLSIGVGLKYPMTDNIAFRLETRALATLYNNNSAVFCNGGCSLTINGNFFLQGEVFAGLAIKF